MDHEQKKVKVNVADLSIGHYVDLELSWMHHPFLFSRFRITSAGELAAILELGLKEVTIIPDRCDPGLAAGGEESAAATPESAAPPPSAAPEGASIRQEMWSRKKELMKRASGFRDERAQAAERYQGTVRKITAFARDIRTAPANAVTAAESIVEDLARAFEGSCDVLLNLINLNDADFTMYSHSLNVTVLSVLLGRHLQLSDADIRTLGVGAIVHDIGKIEIPSQITNKTQALTPGEEALLRTHAAKGARLAQRIGSLPPEVIAIIEQHHEHLDGSGYPQRLRGGAISKLARIVAVTNTYDDLCNPNDPTQATSPRDAMAHLFRNFTAAFDADIVKSFIKAMGVYPPGTVVQLTDDNTGMVISVDREQLLRPRVILYNPDIPRADALMVDLRERTDLEIRNVLKPGQVPTRIYDYLGLSARLGYFCNARGADAAA
jgi:putative nucleotidyltransferase with HDIG domain